MSKPKATVVSKAKAPASSSTPRKTPVDDDFARMERGAFGDAKKDAAAGRKKPAIPTGGAATKPAAVKKSPAELSDAEMREKVKAMMGRKSPEPSTSPSPRPAAAALSAPTSKIVSKNSIASPRSPPAKSSPRLASARAEPASPLSPSPAAPRAVGKAAAPPAAAPAPAARPAPVQPAGDDEDDDYYDEDFDEDAATVEEEEPSPSHAPVPVLPSPPSRPNKLTNTSSPAALHASRPQMGKEDAPSSPGEPSWKSPPRSNDPGSPHSGISAAAARPKGLGSPVASSASSAPVVSPSFRKVVLPSSKQVQRAQNRELDERRRQRAAAILSRVALVEEDWELFSMTSVSAWDHFMREIGRGNKRNIASQYNDDWREEEAQTDDSDWVHAETQAPEDRFVSFSSVREKEKMDGAATDGEEVKRGSPLLNVNTRLHWLHSAALVMEALIMENISSAQPQHSLSAVTAHYQNLLPSPAALAALTLGHYSLTLPAHFGSRAITDTAFCANLNVLFIAYAKPTVPPSPDTLGLGLKGLIAVWELGGGGRVKEWLYCDGEISVVAVEEERGWLVVAGLDEGSVAVWDLREAATLHRHAPLDGVKGDLVLRHASYTTDGDFAVNGEPVNHRARVCQVRFIQRQRAQTKRLIDGQDSAKEDETTHTAKAFDFLSLASSSSSDFVFLTLDASASLITWTGVEVRDASLAGSEADLGLAIGSKVKVHRSQRKEHGESSEGVDVQVRADDNEEYVIALSGGRVLRRRRFGDDPTPSSYVPLRNTPPEDTTTSSTDGDDGARPLDDVTCIVFHPLFSDFFLAGYASGLIALYTVQSSTAIQLWFPTKSSAIVSLHWAPSSPSTFFAFSSPHTLSTYNLITNPSTPGQSVVLDGARRIDVLGQADGGVRAASWLVVLEDGKERGHANAFVLKNESSATAADERDSFAAYLERAR